MNIDSTFLLIRQWAVARNIVEGSTIADQTVKFFKETGELMEALLERSVPGKEAEAREKMIDGFGDAVVVLTIMAAQVGLCLEDCIEAAYEEIKHRKGRMIDGVFVKEADL